MSYEIEKILWLKVNRYLPFLQMLPFVKVVAVCNNLAFGAVNEKSDIDLFIVAKSGRLFLVRFMVTTVLHLLGVRRHGEKIYSRFCLSFFVGEESLDFSNLLLEEDYYFAAWLLTLKPVILLNFSIDEFSKLLLEKNPWLKSFGEKKRAEYSWSGDYLLADRRYFAWIRWFLGKIFGGFVGDFLEKKLMKWQLGRANKKKNRLDNASGTVLSPTVLKFHNVDRRAFLNSKYLEIIGEKGVFDLQKFLAMMREIKHSG